MAEYVFAVSPYNNSLMLIGELNSYCEKCKKKNRDDKIDSLMYSYKNIEDKNKNETMEMQLLKTKTSETRWKLDYVGDAVPVRGRRLNNLNSMRNEDDYPTYSTNIVDCFIKETKYKPKPKEHFTYTLEDKFKELFNISIFADETKTEYKPFYQIIKELSEELDKKLDKNGGNKTMPNITDYTYDPDTATTTITWSDNTTTTVTAEDKAAADQYTGFMTAYAKKAAGNTSRIQSIYERAIKLPEKKALAEQKAKEKEEEQRKIRENQKARKRRQRVRREARRRKEQYEKTLLMDEAKRLAEKEYGVPYEQSDWLKQSGDGANGKTET